MFSTTLTKLTLAVLATTITSQAQTTIDVSTAPGYQSNGIVTFHNNQVTNTCNYRVGAMNRYQTPIASLNPHSHPYNLNGATVSISLTLPGSYTTPSSVCSNKWSSSADIPAGFTCTISNCQHGGGNTCSAHLHCVPPPTSPTSVTIRIADAPDEVPVDLVPVQVVAADVPVTDPVLDDGVGDVYDIVNGDGRVVAVAYD
ncbi:hypothetical protein HDV00_005893 [Rhizophlyctis rosea]|nr:hypothetical protein HDV00_005893 [Rhizophlyctis rosea]